MFGAACKLVVIVIVELVVCRVLLVAYKADKLGNVQFLTEVLDVETKVNNHLFTLVRALVADKEGAGHSGNYSVREFQLLFNVKVSEELRRPNHDLVFARPQLLD